MYQRYANPVPLLNGMIRTRRFSEFVGEFVELYNEEKKDKTLWEIWLHRVFDKSYNDFTASIGAEKAEKATDEETAKIVRESKGIFAAFKQSSTTAE